MKTAVSIPNDVYESAEDLAKQLETSRSKLYTLALKSYIKKRRSEAITEQVNDVYNDIDSSLDPTILRAQLHSMSKEDW